MFICYNQPTLTRQPPKLNHLTQEKRPKSRNWKDCQDWQLLYIGHNVKGCRVKSSGLNMKHDNQQQTI